MAYKDATGVWTCWGPLDPQVVCILAENSAGSKLLRLRRSFEPDTRRVLEKKQFLLLGRRLCSLGLESKKWKRDLDLDLMRHWKYNKFWACRIVSAWLYAIFISICAIWCLCFSKLRKNSKPYFPNRLTTILPAFPFQINKFCPPSIRGFLWNPRQWTYRLPWLQLVGQHVLCDLGSFPCTRRASHTARGEMCGAGHLLLAHPVPTSWFSCHRQMEFFSKHWR